MLSYFYIHPEERTNQTQRERERDKNRILITGDYNGARFSN